MSQTVSSCAEQDADLASDCVATQPCCSHCSCPRAAFCGTALGRQSHRVTKGPRLREPCTVQTTHPGDAIRRHWRPACLDFARQRRAGCSSNQHDQFGGLPMSARIRPRMSVAPSKLFAGDSEKPPVHEVVRQTVCRQLSHSSRDKCDSVRQRYACRVCRRVFRPATKATSDAGHECSPRPGPRPLCQRLPTSCAALLPATRDRRKYGLFRATRRRHRRTEAQRCSRH